MGGPLLQNHLALLADFKVVRPALGEERVCGLVAMGTARQYGLHVDGIPRYQSPKVGWSIAKELGTTTGLDDAEAAQVCQHQGRTMHVVALSVCLWAEYRAEYGAPR